MGNSSHCQLYKVQEAHQYAGALSTQSNDPDVLIFDDGSVYKGEMKNKKPHGKGVLTRKDGSVHDGEFENGFANGYSIVKYPNGDFYKGYFVDGGDTWIFFTCFI